MQPTYFPWIGYFKMINDVNLFIFLDDVQYSKGSWHSRNKILNKSKEIWLTISLKKHKLNTNLNEISIFNLDSWKRTHINLLKSIYLKHPYYLSIKEISDFLISIKTEILSEVNIMIIKFICEKLFIKTKTVKSSNFNIDEKRTKKIITLLNNFKVNEYLSPAGSKNYLEEDNFNIKTSIKLKFTNYQFNKYSQFYNNSTFVEKLSIIDIIANLGWDNTKKYILEAK
jgi:hypothetical protein